MRPQQDSETASRYRARAGLLLRRCIRAAGGIALSLAVAVPLASAARTSEAPPHYVRVIGDTAPEGYLNSPMGVAVSPAEDGRLYIADTHNARVAVFSAEGQPIGNWGERGNGPGKFWRPTDVAVSRDGRYVYVIDEIQSVVQRFEPRMDCFELGGPTCFGPERIVMWGGRGIGAGAFSAPMGIAVDTDGLVYVSDASANTIQVFSAEGSHLRSFGQPGRGLGELNHPTDLAITPDKLLLVADRNNDRIAYFTLKGEAVTYFNGGGRFFRPTGIAVGPDGALAVRDYEASWGTPRTWRFDSERRLRWQVDIAGEEMDYSYPLQGIAILPSDRLAITTATAVDATLAFLGDQGQSQPVAFRGRSLLQFDKPADVAVDEYFHVVADRGNQRVLILDPLDNTIGIFGGEANPAARLNGPTAVAVHRTGPALADAVIYVVDPGTHSVHRITPYGELLGTWGGRGSSPESLDQPEDVAVAPDGEVFIADTNNHRIVHRAADGEVLGVMGDAEVFQFPMSVAFGPRGLVYVVEARRNRVQAFDPLDRVLAFDWQSEADPIDPAPGSFWLPVAVAADREFVYVMESDQRDHVRVQVFGFDKEFPHNVFTVFAEGAGANPGQLWNPADLSVSDDGQILIADSGNNRVQLFAWPGSEPQVPPTRTPSPPVPTRTPTDPPPPETPVIIDPTDVPTEEPSLTGTPEIRPTLDLPTNVAPTAEIQPTPNTGSGSPRPAYLPLAFKR
jgi:tripartite motif-containing protein 71